MKTKFIAVIILIFSFYCCSEKEKQENDLIKNNIKGNVKSTKTGTFKAIEKFGEIVKGQVYSPPFTEIFFNEKGYIIEENQYKNGSLSWKTKCKYEKNNIIEKNGYNSDGQISSKTELEYDQKGNIIKKTKYPVIKIFWKGKRIKYETTFKYNKNGNKIEENRFNSDNTLGTKVKFKYNEKGDVIEVNEYNSDGSLRVKKRFTYTISGNIEEEIAYKPDGDLFWKNVYKYNKNNDYSEYLIFNNKDILDSKITYEYQYDNHNNWIKKIEFSNEKPDVIVEREIEYYN